MDDEETGNWHNLVCMLPAALLPTTHLQEGGVEVL